MKGYKFFVWKWSAAGEVNVTTRTPVIHARNLKEAWKKFENECPVENGEFVYDVKCLGTVKKVVKISWEYTPLKRPRYESRY